jgi:hypothetical protein
MHNGHDSAPAANGVVPHPKLRFGMHRRVPVSTYLDPELYEWLVVEAKVHHITISEQVQRIVRQQQNLRKDLAALVEPQETTPVFQVLLERHGEKVSKTMDGAVKQLARLQTALDLLKTMVAHSTRMGLTPKQFSQWEQDVQDTMKGRSS